MIYVRSKMNPPPKVVPSVKSREIGYLHAITVGDPIVNKQIFLQIREKSWFMKYHDFYTQSDVDHRLFNIF